ncbi:hypothetical protein D9M68_565890 [compost metagenome]
MLAFAQQRRHRHVQMLAEQVEQRRLQGGHRMDGNAQVEGLQPATAGIAISEGAPDAIENPLPMTNRLSDHQRAGILQRLANGLAARHLADADAAGAVLEDQNVSGEVRTMSAAEVEQHAVPACDRDYLKFMDNRRSALFGI